MSTLLDLTGRRFERLTVIHRAPSKNGETCWECLCDCGNLKTIRGKDLRRRFTKSCGCHNSAVTTARNMKHGAGRRNARTPEWRTWMAMRQRCANGRNKDYGGRGIRVCDRWRESFANFFADMGPRPFQRATIERKNNDGNYEPTNCKWASYTEQNRNSRRNRIVEWRGRKMPISAWAEERGIPRGVLWARVHAGWPIDRAMTEPVA